MKDWTRKKSEKKWAKRNCKYCAIQLGCIHFKDVVLPALFEPPNIDLFMAENCEPNCLKLVTEEEKMQ